MIELQPFAENDFDTFIAWIKNEEELFQFAGSIFTFPVTREQLTRYVTSSERKSYKVILSETKEVIGHCELNFEGGGHRLSRVLIADESQRGKGIGKKIVLEMASLFFEDATVMEVNLNVFDWNTEAMRCYEKVGFKLSNFVPKSMVVKGETWVCLNMILSRSDYNALLK